MLIKCWSRCTWSVDQWLIESIDLHSSVDAFSTHNPLTLPYIRNWPLPIGAFQDQCKQTMTNTSIQLTGGRSSSWLFTRVAERLNLEQLKTTPATSQNKIWTRSLRISNPALARLPPKTIKSFGQARVSNIDLAKYGMWEQMEVGSGMTEFFLLYVYR